LHGLTISPWVAAHPEGDLIATYPGKTASDRLAAQPIYQQRFRGEVVMIWRDADIIAHPELLELAHK
jgi:hypothetical protein